MGLVEEILIGLALGVIILVHAMLATTALFAAREADDCLHACFYIIIALVLMLDPLVYAIAMRVTG